MKSTTPTVTLGRPTEHQCTKWFFQRYTEQLPNGGEQVLFDRSWHNRAMVEPVFGFCSWEAYDNFMRGFTRYLKNIVRPRTVLFKSYFNATKMDAQLSREAPYLG